MRTSSLVSPAPQSENIVNIKVVGIGGAGCNVLTRMNISDTNALQRIAINTDTRSINGCTADDRIQIGIKRTNGLGSGSDPQLGRLAAEDDRTKIEAVIKNCDMVIITSGMGGGVGTGASPVVAEIAKNLGILTIAIVTKPFSFEGREKMRRAEAGISELNQFVDAIVVIPNDNLKYATSEKITFGNALEVADNVLGQTLKNIIDLIQKPMYINSDFADVKAILRNSGLMHICFAQSSGENRVSDLISAVSKNTLLNTSLSGAKGLLLCITASPDVSLDEVDTLSTAIQESVHQDANIIFGMDFEGSPTGSIRVMVIATSIEANS